MTILNEIPYGLRREVGKEFLVHISEIKPHERGLRCNCICPKCHSKLQAKLPNNDINYTPRFAHHGDIECDFALETVLHMKAKEILEKEKYIVVPKILARYKNLTELISEEGQIDFDKVYLENKLDDIIPDILCYSSNQPLIVEIKVTHSIDNIKREKIKKLNISTLEIDLSKITRNFDPESLYNEVIINTGNKKWIYNKDAEEQIEVLKEKYLIHEENLRKKHIENQRREYEKIPQKTYNEKTKEDFAGIPLLKQLIEEQERRGKLFKENQYRELGILPKNEIIKKYMDLSYQKELTRKWDEELRKNMLWKTLAHKVIFFVDIIPEHINQEIPGEILFGCDRRIWQLYIFCVFIYNKAKKINAPISVYRVQSSIINNFKMSLIEELAFKQGLDECKDVPCLKDVIHQYLKRLENYGYLEEVPPGDVKYERWTVLDPSGVK